MTAGEPAMRRPSLVLGPWGSAPLAHEALLGPSTAGLCPAVAGTRAGRRASAAARRSRGPSTGRRVARCALLPWRVHRAGAVPAPAVRVSIPHRGAAHRAGTRRQRVASFGGNRGQSSAGCGVLSACSACCSKGRTARTRPSGGLHAAPPGPPTPDSAGVPWPRGPGDAACFLRARSAGPPCPAMEPPGLPPPLAGTEGDSHLPRTVCDRRADQAAGTVGIIVASGPQQGLGRFSHLAARTPCRTRGAHWGPLGARHASLLLKAQEGLLPPRSPCLFF